jgi:carbamoyl-phosphate synthase large subunit
MKRRNVLVLPAGTEIGLEIQQALKHCKDIRLFGAGLDVSNHARLTFPEYFIIPAVHDSRWLAELIQLCHTLSIDYILPGHDDVLLALSRHRADLPAAVISSPPETCEVTRSKRQTFRALSDSIRVPRIYTCVEEVADYPVFVKPDRGQGSLGACRVNSRSELLKAIDAVSDPLICEFLPGDEYTVDCFSDRERGLLFAGARSRLRIRNGISVNTQTENLPEIPELARTIERRLSFYGAWFFQIRRAVDGQLALLEVAARIAGAMSTHRVTGVNFPLLSIYEHERLPLQILVNPGTVQLDRGLSNRYIHDISFSTLYVDLDDTLILHGRINTDLVRFIYKCVSSGRVVKLLTRHRGDLSAALRRFRIGGLFDVVIHLKNAELKSSVISETDAILIDDSFSERRDVSNICGIATFDCSMVELLDCSDSMGEKYE